MTATETESFTTISCLKCSAVYPGLPPALRRPQATLSLEKRPLTALPKRHYSFSNEVVNHRVMPSSYESH